MFVHISSKRDENPVRHKPHQTFNKFRTIEHTNLIRKRSRSRDGRSIGSTSQVQLNPRYKYSEVPAIPTRVRPDEIGPYKQFKKKKYKPKEDDKIEAEKEKKKEESKDEDEDEDPELTRTTAKETTDRVRVKRILSKRHPTKSLSVGTLKRNVILTQGDSTSTIPNRGSSTVQTTDRSVQASSLSTQSIPTSAGTVNTRIQFNMLSNTSASSRIIDVICSMTKLWNYGKRNAQLALLGVLTADPSNSNRVQLINTFKDKCERKKAAYTLQGLLRRLLLNICGGDTRTKATGISKLADHIYEMHEKTLNQDTPPKHNIAVSVMATPLSVEMAKSITMHWKTQSELMIEKVSY